MPTIPGYVPEDLILSDDVYNDDPATVLTPAGTLDVSGSLAQLLETPGKLTTYDGMTVIAQSPITQISDGFAAIAVKDSSGNVIIINEGTVTGVTSYDLGTMSTDKLIAQGLPITQIKALQDAQAFARTVEGIVGSGTPIDVTGHSLGGTEAEAEAQELVTVFGASSFGDGATFGATGLPSQNTAGGPSGLIDYVDFGDPVGNDALDTANKTVNPLYPNAKAYYHYGQAQMWGSPSNAMDLQSSSVLFKLNEAIGPSVSIVTNALSLLTIVDESQSLHDHYLDNYANDLLGANNGLGIGPSPVDLDSVAMEAGVPYGNVGASDPADETVQSNGTVSDPDFTVTYNTTTNQLTIDQTGSITTLEGTAAGGGVTTLSLDPSTYLVDSATYVSADGSTYNATLNEATGNIQSLEVNESSGASYQTNYTYNPDGSMSAVSNGYSGTNLSGTHQYTETVNVSSAGAFSANISGTGDAATFTSATITLQPNASLSLTGTGNSITLGTGASVSDTSSDLASDNLTFNDATSDSITLDAGTYSSSASSYTNSGAQSVSLVAPDGITLGTLAFNTTNDTDSFTLSDGVVLTLQGISGNLTVSPDTTAGDGPYQVLQDYLTDLGYSGNLSAANFAYLNPTGSPYEVTGTVNGTTDTFNLGANSAPGAVVAGVEGDTNILSVSSLTDLTQDSISNVQVLQLNNGAEVELTVSQLNAFSSVTGSGTIVLTTPGQVSLASSEFSGGAFNLTAQGWNGTIMTGSNGNGQTLAASTYGDDTLKGGNGTGDVFIAGLGVDAITGGTGSGDMYDAYFGLTPGSSITAHGASAQLNASGDISQATINGITNLQLTGNDGTNITMTAVEFNGFTSIFSIPGSVASVTINDSGTYSINASNLTSKAAVFFGASTTTTATINAPSSATQTVSYNASGSGNIALTMDGNGGANLTISGTGNDTLTVTSGNGNNLSVSGTGNNTLTAGNGTSETLSATGFGTDTLTAGTGAGDSLTASGSGTYILAAGKGAGDTLSLTGSGGSITASGGTASISVDGSDNAVTAKGAKSIITAQGGFNTISATAAGDTFNLYDTDNSVTLGSAGSNILNLLGLTTGETGVTDYTGLVVSGGTGKGNVLNVDDSTLDLTQTQLSNVAVKGMSTLVAASSLATLTGLSFANGTGTLQAEAAGTYNVSTLDTADQITMLDTSTTGGVTLIDNGAGGDELLTGNTGDTLVSGNGKGDFFEDTGNNDTITAGNGAGDNFLLEGAGITVTAGSGTKDYVSSMGNNNAITLGNGASDTIVAYGSNDTLTVGNGTGDTIEAIGNHDTITGGSGTDTFAITGIDAFVQSGGGTNTYDANATSGDTVINNYHTNTTQSTLNLGSTFTTSDTAVTQVGNNLVLTDIGTTNQVTVQDYFEGTDWQLPIDFANKTSWNLATVESMLQTPITLTDGTTTTITTSGHTINAGNNDNVTLTTSSAGTVAISGSGNTITDTSSTTLDTFGDAAAGSNNTFHLSGTGDVVTIAGTGDTATESGANEGVTITGTGDTANDLGTGGNMIALEGTSDMASINAAGDTTMLSGSKNSAIINSGGSKDTITDAGTSDITQDSGTSDTVTLSGSSDTITLKGTNGTADLTGNSDTATLTGGSGNVANLSGTGDSASDTGTSVDSFNLTGTSDNAVLANSQDTATIAGSGNTATENGGSESITVTGTGDTAKDAGTGSNTITLNGSSNTANIYNNSDSVTVNGTLNAAYITSGVSTGTATFVGTNGEVNIAGTSSESIVFDASALGTLLLQDAQGFSGTVAGFASGDDIDLTNFAFANGATISNVTGTGAQGTDTVITVSDNGVNAQIALLNQYANQFAVNASAYTLTADSNLPNLGTLFQLAAAH